MKRAILLLIFPLLALAAPGPGTRYLINEPTSLLDIGILRAEIALTDLMQAWESAITTPHVIYDFEDDLVIVEARIYSLGISDENVKTECKGIIGRLRIYVDLFAKDWFSHRGYVSGKPKDLYDDLYDRIELRCRAMGSGLSARSRLKDEKLFWSEEDDE